MEEDPLGRGIPDEVVQPLLGAAAPITPLALFADRVRSGAYVARMLMFAAMMGMFFFLTQFLQQVLGYSPLLTGLAFLPTPLALFAGSQASARVLVDRFGDYRVLLVGVGIATLGMSGLTRLSTATGYLDVLGPLVLLGLGIGAAMVPLTSAGLAGVRPEHAGAASGLVNVSQQVGGSLGLALLITVFVTAQDTSTKRAEYAFLSGIHAAFLAAAVLLATCVAVVGALLRHGPAPRG